jgi:hypothetical protein
MSGNGNCQGQPPLDEAAVEAVRRVILRFFAASAEQMGEVLALPLLRVYERQQVKRVVYALHLAGLLEKWGATRGCWYYTTPLGKLVLAALDERLRDKAQERDQRRVE